MMTIRRRLADDRGAAAVEFALVLPVLLLLLLGLMEFSRIYNVQISLSNGAREAARTMAIHNDVQQARQAAIAGSPSISPAIGPGHISISPSSCAPGSTVQVSIGYTVDLFTGFFGAQMPLTGTAAMRCGG